MSLSSLLQLAAACIGIVGSLFFAIGVVRQSAEAMAHQAGTYWDSNPHVVASLAAQKADYLFGGGTIVLAFVGQLASVFVSPDRGALSEGGARLVLWLAVPVTVASFCLLRIGSKKLAKRYASQIDESIKARAEEQAAA